MFPYFFLIGFPLLLSLISYDDGERVFSKKTPLFMFFFILIIMLALRDVTCGTDLLIYRFKFNHPSALTFFSLFDFSLTEPGFRLLMAICKKAFNSFQLFLVFCALLSVVPIMVLYLKESNHSILTIALFVGLAPFSMFFSGLRQSIAIGIGVICYLYCKQKKLIPFLVLVFVAYLFHQSAIILLIMYPLMHVRITKKWTVPLAALLAVCFVYRAQIFSFMLSVNDRYENVYTISRTGSYTYLILLLILTVYSFVMLKDSEFDSFGLRNILTFTLILQCFASVNSVAMRLNYYYLIFIPLLIPKVIDSARAEFWQIAKVSEGIFVCFFFFWFFKEAYTGADILQLFPYVPFWAHNGWY